MLSVKWIKIGEEVRVKYCRPQISFFTVLNIYEMLNAVTHNHYTCPKRQWSSLEKGHNSEHIFQNLVQT